MSWNVLDPIMHGVLNIFIVFVVFYYFFFFSEAQLISEFKDLACFRYLGIFQRCKILFIFHDHQSNFAMCD